MSRHQPVVWSEGLLLAPQHLQQWDRYVHHLVSDRFRQAYAFEWGLTQLEVDRESLRNGRVSLTGARGVLPDGTPFSAPGEDPLPPPRALEGHFDARQESFTVCLGLPAARPGRPLLGVPGTPGQPAPRYSEEALELADDNTAGDERGVTVARRNLALLFPDDPLGDFDQLPIAEVVRTADGGFALREGWVPPCLSVGASDTLLRLLRADFEALITKSSSLGEKRRQRGSLADFSSADTTSFLLLHTVNSYIPALAHLLAHRRAHPEQAYAVLASLAGALCTFSADKHPKDLPGYDHRGLGATFAGLHQLIAGMLEIREDTRATRIDLAKEGAVYVGRILDDRLFATGASFYLGVRADAEEQRLIAEVPVKLKTASLDKIDFLVAMALRGVPVSYVRVTPAALPVKTQFVYFLLDPSSELWEGIKGARNLAFYLPPEYPGLTLELLGLRE